MRLLFVLFPLFFGLKFGLELWVASAGEVLYHEHITPLLVETYMTRRRGTWGDLQLAGNG